jgi:catechol-2,3-dioxygenase
VRCAARLMLVHRPHLFIADPDGIEIEIMVDADPQIWRDNPAAVATVELLNL